MNILKRQDNNPETKGIVMHHMAWAYDLGCSLPLRKVISHAYLSDETRLV